MNSDNRAFYVYVVFRPTGIPCYVGKGTGGRWKEHVRRSHNERLQRIFAKAGGALPIVTVRENMTEPEAFAAETALIAAIGRDDLGAGPLVNLTNGGEGFTGGRHSEAYRAQVGARTRGKAQRAEHTAKIREALSGVTRSPLSPECRAALSDALRSSPKAEAHRAKLAAVSSGVPLTANHRAKIAAALRGKPFSVARRAACSAGQKRRFANSPRPWIALGVSRRTWYRHREAARATVA